MKKRPFALIAAMVACILMGLSGFLGGATDVAWFRGDVSDEARVPPGTSEEDAQRLAALSARRREIRDAGRRRLLPLAVANLLVSALLFVAANRALVGRPGARTLALQAIAANALVAVLTHALTSDVRGQLIDALLTFQAPGALKVPSDVVDPRAFLWVVYRIQLGLGLGLYGLAWAALSTQSARAYLAPAPASTDTRPERDD